jgi:hypothetical protein
MRWVISRKVQVTGSQYCKLMKIHDAPKLYIMDELASRARGVN